MYLGVLTLAICVLLIWGLLAGIKMLISEIKQCNKEEKQEHKEKKKGGD